MRALVFFSILTELGAQDVERAETSGRITTEPCIVELCHELLILCFTWRVMKKNHEEYENFERNNNNH